jgi:hypothetical protein
MRNITVPTRTISRDLLSLSDHALAVRSIRITAKSGSPVRKAETVKQIQQETSTDHHVPQDFPIGFSAKTVQIPQG